MGAYLYGSVLMLVAVTVTAVSPTPDTSSNPTTSSDIPATHRTDIPISHNTDIPLAQPAGSCGLHCGCPAVSSLLQLIGFSPACVASSLAVCSNLQGENQISASLEEIREALQDVRGVIKELKAWRDRPRHCKDLLASGDSGRGVRKIYPYPSRPHDAATVFCDHMVDGGGWTVFQHRTNATSTREDFIRTWVEYQLGFGNLESEFWLGLDLLHTLTSWSLQELRVDLADFDGEQRYAKYGMFSVGPASDNYRLSVGRYSGDAGDGLSQSHNGMMFSTPESDHDAHETNCASRYRGGWWYAACHKSNLNGYQHEGHHEAYAEGINWHPWHGYHYSLMNTTLMIRPAF